MHVAIGRAKGKEYAVISVRSKSEELKGPFDPLHADDQAGLVPGWLYWLKKPSSNKKSKSFQSC